MIKVLFNQPVVLFQDDLECETLFAYVQSIEKLKNGNYMIDNDLRNVVHFSVINDVQFDKQLAA